MCLFLCLKNNLIYAKIKLHNQVLEPTLGSIVALRGIIRAGATQQKRQHIKNSAASDRVSV